MGGRLVASEQAVIGYVPPKFETEEVLDERVVLTGSGDYTVPEGVYTPYSGMHPGWDRCAGRV